MEDLFAALFDWFVTLYGRTLLLAGGVLFSAIGLLPAAVILYAIWVAVSAGHRRQQRARSFIDLIEIGLKQGRTVEETVQSLSGCRVKELGVHFHLLAAWMERGLRLSAALAEVPRFLPPHVRAMLSVGERIGDLNRVLPVCRATLQGGASNTQTNLNTLMVLLFVSPVGPGLVWFISIFVFPKFRAIVQDLAMEGAIPGAIFSASTPFAWSLVLANVILAAWLFFLLSICLQGTAGWMRHFPGWTRLADGVSLRIPWRRRRMQRNFSALLALLLDAAIPEADAVRLAAAGTGNSCFQRRAERVLEDLKQGVKLTDAVRWLDDQGEFRWRLRNVVQAQSRFVSALAGWQEALEAKAYRQEQLFSQALTSGFVLLNGVMVGFATVGVFGVLVHITEVVLW